MATVTSVKCLCNTVFMLMLLAALSTCHGNAFRAWIGKQRKKKLAIYRAWPWISNCWEWDPNSGLSGIESSALTTRPRRLGANRDFKIWQRERQRRRRDRERTGTSELRMSEFCWVLITSSWRRHNAGFHVVEKTWVLNVIFHDEYCVSLFTFNKVRLYVV